MPQSTRNCWWLLQKPVATHYLQSLNVEHYYATVRLRDHTTFALGKCTIPNNKQNDIFYATVRLRDYTRGVCYSRQHTGWCFMPLCAIPDNILDGVLCHCVLFQTTYWNGVLCHYVLFQTTYGMLFYVPMCYSRQHMR